MSININAKVIKITRLQFRLRSDHRLPAVVFKAVDKGELGGGGTCPPKFSIAFYKNYYSAITCVAIAMLILKYIVPIRPGVSSKEDSDVRQTSGSTGSRSAEVILHSSESSSKPISGSDEVVGLLEECGHDEANAPDSPSPTTSPVTCTRIVPLKPNQPRLKFPMRQFGSKRRSFCYSWYEKYRWLHYIEEEDAVLCFYCATAVQLKMPMRGYVMEI